MCACTLRFGQLAIVHAEAWAGGRGAPLPMGSQRWPRVLHELAESEEIVEAGSLDPVVYIYCHSCDFSPVQSALFSPPT